jgi:hypothetical protein
MVWLIIIVLIVAWLVAGIILGIREDRAAKATRIISKELMQFGIISGREVFTSRPIDDGLPCKVVVEGQDTFDNYGSGERNLSNSLKLDAVYFLSGQQYSRHHSFLLDGQPAEIFAEDPYKHKYSFLYAGTGRQLSIFLRLPKGCTHSSHFSDSLQLSILTLTVAEEAEIKAKQDQQLREVAELEREELNRQALTLVMQADLGSNFLKPDFQQSYAAKNIIKVLTQDRREWFTEYQKLRSNEPLFALIQEHYPSVLEFFSARFEVVRIAERLAVADPKQKPKLSREEWEAKIERYRQRQVDRVRVGADDKIEKLLARYKSLQHLRERAEQLGLDSDTIDRLERELRSDMDDNEESGTGYQQLS